jgi:hypothetical protein
MTEDREHQQDGHGGGGITLGELAERLGISIGYAADTVAGLMEDGVDPGGRDRGGPAGPGGIGPRSTRRDPSVAKR